ncbi:MAG: LuxR C-terminal-related transcriptional regulator [Candidatus Aminicenantes bacterium]|nr:LuxR C-terminal-related transcriptional regulator [Candidatus Aminicenantes bacterium]
MPGYTDEPPFQNISVEDGLSQNTVICMLQDRNHFMWFGSEDGLDRFDGYSFKVYRHSQHHDEGLSHDRISCLLNNRDGTIWIGTLGGGLDHFDPGRERFSHYRHDPHNERSLSHDTVQAILPDGKGSFWVGTENGLNLFDPGRGTFLRILHAQERAGVNSACAILSLHQDNAGILWIGTRDGLHRYDRASGQCRALSGSGAAIIHTGKGSDQINTIFEDSLGNLWLGTEAGLVLFNKRDGTFQSKESGGTSPLPHLYRSRILDIIADDRGGIWIACEAGIYFFPQPGQLAIYFRAGAVPHLLLQDRFVLSLYQDPEGILWAGTFSGIWKYDLRTRQFSLYGPELIERERSDFRFPVLSVCQDKRSWLWIGTYKNGLFGANRSVDEKKTFTSLPGNPRAVKEMLISALQVDRGQTLWIGTTSGLHRYDIGRDRFTGYYHSGKNGGGLSNDSILAIFEDRSGRLWVGTEDGLNLFDRGRGSFRVYLNDLPTASRFGPDIVIAMYQDAGGSMWIGTYGGGLYLFDPENGRFVRNYRHRSDDPASLSSDNIYCFLEDSRGRFWVGTNSGGLNLFDRSRGTFSHLTTEEGLPNNTILGILEDKAGNLWLSTSHGLCRFDPQRNVFRNFTARDGLQADEFLPKAFFKGADDELFFGGPNGLTCFFAENIKENPHVPPLVITEVEIFNRNQTIAGDMSRIKKLELGYKDSIVSFAFAALSYADPRRNQYAYKIEGLHDDWIHIGNRHEITVSNLRPGHYVFRVKGSNNHGVWNEQGVALAIDMRPPWWQTWWFRVSAFLLLVFVFILLNRTRTRRLAARIRTEAAMEQYLSKCDISQREKEIVMLLLKGKSNKEIEDALFIAMGTVKNHIYSIYQKIGVKNRAQLITLFKNLQVK